MKNPKSFLSAFLVLALLLALLAGCAPPTETTTGTPESTSPTDGGTPTDSASIDENGFWEGIKALDYVGAFNYQALSIPNDVHLITDEALQTEIDNNLANYSTSVQVLDRAVVDGDTVNIDYVGSVDGVEFEGGSTGGAGTEVTIGVTSYIDDFLEQLIGHMPGDTFGVEVTFPDDYQETSLQGKDAVFMTTINHIVEKTAAELTDEFIESNLSADFGWLTVEEMREGTRQEMQRNAIQQYIEQYLANEVPVESMPEQLTSYYEEDMIAYYENYATMSGVELEQFLMENEGVATVEELIAAYKDDNVSRAKYSLISQAVAENESLSISDQDVADYFIKYFGSDDYSTYEADYGLPYLKQVVLCQKVLDLITENAVLA